MEPEIDVICIGSPSGVDNDWIFQELLFQGISSLRELVIEENSESFREILKKSSKRVFCIGKSDSFKKIALEFSDKTILWLPEDLQKIRPVLQTKVIHFCLLLKDQLKEAVQSSPQVKIVFYSWEDKVSMIMTSFFEESLEKCIQSVRSKFSSYEIPCPLGNIALALQEKLIKLNKTVSFAESCTGGYLSHLMTSNAGSSQCFLGSFITYSNAFKNEILGVKQETLERYGAVSSQTVEEMLSGVLRLSKSDFAIAVSGVAGPDGGSEKIPVGSVWFSIGERGNPPETGLLQLQGDRQSIISLASHHVLSLLYIKAY